MLRTILLVLGWCSILPIVLSVSGFYDNIYKDLLGFPCVRLLNASGTIGCQAKSGTTGVLYRIENQNDITHFVDSSPKEKYAVILPAELFTSENLKTLKDTSKVSGIVVSGEVSASKLEGFSTDLKTPNQASSLYANDNNAYIWNPKGNGMMYDSYNFPIFAINGIDTKSNDTLHLVLKAAEDNALKQFEHPLKAVQFNSFMYATTNSETCLRRGFCTPVGGFSVYSTLSSNIQHNDGKPIVVLSAAMDSNSFFHDLAFGVDNNLSGMIGLMAVADALSKNPTMITSLPKHILYTFFNAESWGYSGSSRFVQDISTAFTCQKPFSKATNGCPYIKATCEYPCIRDNEFTKINFENIDSIIELNQIGKSGSASKDSTFFIHKNDNSTSNISLANLIAKQSNGNIILADSDNVYRGLPPASVMSFLKKKAIPAAVITDFRSEVNRYYNSMFDNGQDMELVKNSICSVATTVAKSTLVQASGNLNLDTSTIQANCTLVQELLHCFGQNFSCPLVNRFYSMSNIGRLSYYPGVFQMGQPNVQSTFLYYFMSNLTASERGPGCKQRSDCKDEQSCLAGTCISSLTKFHDAYGTGLKLTEEGRFIVSDSSKPVWTESTWDPVGFQLFLVSSNSSQVIELVVGVLVCILSVVCVILARRYVAKNLKID
ncbi:hypothetical protein K7432_006134 [Basidiobolus ranarum]|uniref:Nicastrin n=1 Tax=Basidiobolus ranarum TaxID=34480 RepID=A0ABR2WVF0_9FUNG